MIFIIFLLGLIVGSVNTVGQRDYFEQAKNNFENKVENQSDLNIPFITEKDKTTKIAQKIDNTIFKTLKKILKRIASEK